MIANRLSGLGETKEFTLEEALFGLFGPTESTQETTIFGPEKPAATPDDEEEAEDSGIFRFLESPAVEKGIELIRDLFIEDDSRLQSGSVRPRPVAPKPPATIPLLPLVIGAAVAVPLLLR